MYELLKDDRVKAWQKEYKVYYVTIAGHRYYIRPLKRSEYLDMLQIRELGIEEDIEMAAVRKCVLNFEADMETGVFEERGGVSSTLYGVISEISGFLEADITEL